MDISSYLQRGESVVNSADAYHDLEDSSGSLAVTTSRLVFVKGDKMLSSGTVLDVSLDAVDAIEYEAPSLPKVPVSWGLLFVGGILFFEFANDLTNAIPLPGEMMNVIPALLFIGFAVCVVLSIIYHRAHLKIYTPSATHKFTARGTNLEKFPNSIRKNS